MKNKRFILFILAILSLLVLFSLSNVSAANFNSSSTNQEIQDFLSNTSAGDNEVVFEGGDYSLITGLTVSRSVNISSTGQVNIMGSNTRTLFTITAPNVKIVNLNISGYKTAINSTTGNLSVIGCNISTTDISFHLEGNSSTTVSLTGILIENNTIISSVTGNTYATVYVYFMNGGSVLEITLKGNNITGNGTSNSKGIRINFVPYSNNTIVFENNNIIGTLGQAVDFNVYDHCNNTITFTNNNITGGNYYGVFIDGSGNCNNTITFTNNNITGPRGFYLDTSINSNNNITLTNNNITGTSNYGLYLDTFTSNNNISVSKNNITGTSSYGVGLFAYNTTKNNINFVDNHIRGSNYGVYVFCEYMQFSGLSVVNNTINATNSNGIGLAFGAPELDFTDILVSGNNIFAGARYTGGRGIVFGNSLRSIDNVTINYNRVLADIGLSIPTAATTGGVDADFNWWANNTPRITGMTLNNWFVMELSANSFWTIFNASTNQSGLVNLTYKFLLYTNSSNTTSSVDFANLPHFLVDILWNNTIENIYNVTGVDAIGNYSHIIAVSGGNFTLNAIGDWSDIILTLFSSNDINLTIVKSVNVTNVTNGDSISYTITVANNGLDNATGVVVSDVLDSRLIFTGTYPGVSYDSVTRTLTWIIGNIGAGESVSLTFVGTVNGTGVIPNIGTVNTNENNIGNNISNEVLITILNDDNPTNETNGTNETNNTESTNETNGTNETNNTESTNEINKTTNTSATMKKTGMPIMGILLVLLTTIVIIIRKEE